MKTSKVTKAIEDLSKKFTSFGVSYATLEAEQRAKEQARSTMVETIKNTINVLYKESTLKTHIFFLCHANYFYKTQQQFYYPAEIALSAFNLQCGLIAAESFFVDPGQIPLGYKHEATEWSSRTHGIPISDPNWKEGIRDPSEMYNRIRKFVRKYSVESESPPFYAMFEDPLNSSDRLSVVECALSMISKPAAGNMSGSEFRIYCLPFLVFEIVKKCCPSQYSSVPIMKRLLDTDVFSYAKDIGCKYHEKKDLSFHCSLSIVKRWVFTVCDLCCKYLGIKAAIGRHVPISYKTHFIDKENKFIKEENKNQTKEINLSEPQTCFTIIDHGRLKELRMEEKKARDLSIQQSRALRLPKRSYRNTTYAKFKGMSKNL